MKPIIIGVTGLPSAGKGLFSESALGFGFRVIVMGDVIRDECQKRGLPVSRESSNVVMVALREERGQNAIAIITLEWIKQAIAEGHKLILIDGIRSLAEVSTFKQEFTEFKLIAIHAGPLVRYQRAMNRQRIDDAISKLDFKERDKIELSVGIGDAIAKSDFLIDSDKPIDFTKNLFSSLLSEITAKLQVSVER